MSQGGEDAFDASSSRSLSAKEPLIVGLVGGKFPIKIRHPMGLCHPAHPILLNPSYIFPGNAMKIRFVEKTGN